MNTKPLVSVLMTAYNREKYIGEAIESVLASTYPHFELIIVDDGSTDNTVTIANNFAKKDERVAVYVNEKNLGDYCNRNRAATYANGKYIKYLDSDDTIYSDGLAYCVGQMEKYPDASFGLAMIDGDHSVPSVLMKSEDVIRRHFFQSTHLSAGPTGMIIKRDLFEKLDGFNPDFHMASDSFFNIKVASVTPVVLLKNRFFFYRIHEGQELNNRMGYFVYGYLANKKMLTLDLPLTKNEKEILFKRFNTLHAIALMRHAFFKGKVRESLVVMKQTNFDFADIFKAISNKLFEKLFSKV
jgi:glycosyltransferase involved in cell wall biosynthesis